MANRHTILVDELALPLYSAMTDQQRLDSLHVEDIEQQGSIQSITIAAKLELENKWALMNDLDGTENYYDDAYHAVLVINTFDSFDMSIADHVTVYTRLVNALVSNNILTQAQVDEITATGYYMISRDREIGAPNSTIGQIAEARTN